jgi:hypothetical protein
MQKASTPLVADRLTLLPGTSFWITVAVIPSVRRAVCVRRQIIFNSVVPFTRKGLNLFATAPALLFLLLTGANRSCVTVSVSHPHFQHPLAGLRLSTYLPQSFPDMQSSRSASIAVVHRVFMDMYVTD